MKKPALATSIVKTVLGLLLVSTSALIDCGKAQAQPSELLFPRPPAIAKAVDFWTRIYSEVDSNSGFIHDSRSLDVIYEVYPLSRYASPKRQHRSIRKRVQHYRRLLRRIAKTPEAKLNKEERRVKRLWGSNATVSQLMKAAKRVRFQRGQSDRMNKGLKRAATFGRRIREILRDAGVPEQLAALPHVESSYNPKVRSKAGASGLWQIMPATGRRYLRVNNVVDERLDPFKATAAAAQLLKHNHAVVKSWPLAITAYNHGLSGVRRAVRKTGSTDIGKIVQDYNGRAFRFASRNFYAAFLAAYDVSNSRRAEFKEKAAPNVPVVALHAYMPATVIVEGLGITEQALKEHNPDLGAAVWSGGKYIPKSYRLHIPVKRDPALLRAQVAVLEIRSGHAKQVPDLIYRVKRGDNLAHIAQRHDTSIEKLMAMNKLRSRHRINAGQVLRIPKEEQAPAAVTAAASSPAEEAAPAAEPVPANATASEIKRGPVPVAAQAAETDPVLASENDTRDAIETDPPADAPPESEESAAEDGETLVIAQSDLAADPADYLVAEDGTIEIQVGETLGHYADWANVPTQKLREINGVHFGQQVIVGERLRLVFSTEDAKAFESKRKSFHTGIQNQFFKQHLIVDVKDHALTRGDNLWELSTQTYQVPLWLLRQYNPDLTFSAVLSSSGLLRVPVLQRNDRSATSTPAPAAQTSRQLAELD